MNEWLRPAMASAGTRAWALGRATSAPASEADTGHRVQLDAVRRLPGHVVDLVEEAETAECDPLVHVLPACGGVVAGHESLAGSPI